MEKEYRVQLDVYPAGEGAYEIYLRLMKEVKLLGFENIDCGEVKAFRQTFFEPTWFERKILKRTLLSKAIAVKKELEQEVSDYLKKIESKDKKLDEIRRGL